MISSAEYKILKSLKKSPELDENRYYNEIRNLLRLKMIEYNVTGETERYIKYCGFFVTPAGDAAIEEYERMIEKQTQEEETLKAAHKSNIISIVSLCISTLFSIPALVVAIVSLIQ